MAYLDGELPVDRAAVVAEHLEECPECQGVAADFSGKEKIYLHVLAIDDADIRRLAPLVDEHGNVVHARLALPREDVWWIAVEGEASWPKLVRPKLVSRCDLASGTPAPVALALADVERLRKIGAKIPTL